MLSTIHESVAVDVVILAGGLGTRLKSVLPDKPKVMADIKGKPFISLLFDQLIQIGIQKVVVSTGYKEEVIRQYFGKYYKNIELIYSNESEPLGTGGALKLAQKNLDKTHMLVLNGDTLISFNFKDFFSYHLSKSNEVTMLLCWMEDTRRYGMVEVDRHGKVLSFSEKSGNVGKGLVNAGVYLVRRECFQSFSEKTNFSLEHDFFPSMIGRNLFGFKNEKPVFDIGTPESYRKFLAYQSLAT
jgi:NDP-sugar pyrophosphorylase family protein